VVREAGEQAVTAGARQAGTTRGKQVATEAGEQALTAGGKQVGAEAGKETAARSARQVVVDGAWQGTKAGAAGGAADGAVRTATESETWKDGLGEGLWKVANPGEAVSVKEVSGDFEHLRSRLREGLGKFKSDKGEIPPDGYRRVLEIRTRETRYGGNEEVWEATRGRLLAELRKEAELTGQGGSGIHTAWEEIRIVTGRGTFQFSPRVRTETGRRRARLTARVVQRRLCKRRARAIAARIPASNPVGVEGRRSRALPTAQPQAPTCGSGDWPVLPASALASSRPRGASGAATPPSTSALPPSPAPGSGPGEGSEPPQRR
jgi:hypothetical protein